MTSSHRIITRERVLSGAKFDFEQVEIELADGKTTTRQIVRHPGAVCICPVLERGDGGIDIVLIRNERWSVGEALWELPAGTLEADERPQLAAERELREESGYECCECIELGWFYTTPGMTDERMHAFVARDLTEVGAALEPDERITVHVTPLEKVWEMVDSGELRDGKTLVTLLRAQRAGHLGPVECEDGSS